MKVLKNIMLKKNSQKCKNAIKIVREENEIKKESVV